MSPVAVAGLLAAFYVAAFAVLVGALHLASFLARRGRMTRR